MRRTHLAASTFALAAAACGFGPTPGRGASPDGAPDADAPAARAPAADAPAAPVVASYDLAFDEVTPEKPIAVFDVPVVTPASRGGRARLDLRRIGGRYDAVVTPRGGAPSAYDVRDDGDAWILTAASSGGVGSGASFESAIARAPDHDVYGPVVVNDDYGTFRVAHDAAGALATSFEAVGAESVRDTDLSPATAISAHGSVVKDTTAPEARVVSLRDQGPADALLPWEPLALRFAEPITAGSYALRAGGASITWQAPSPVDPRAAWAGVTEIDGRLDAWDGVGLATVLAAPLVDAAGNAGDGRAPVRFVAVPPPGASAVDVTAASVATWGDVALLPAGDPRCDAGRPCARVAYTNTCAAPRAGIAARLAVPPSATRATVRWRALMKVHRLAAHAPPIPTQALFVVDTSQGRSADPDLNGFTETTEDGMTAESGWRSLAVDASPAADVGIAIHTPVSLCAALPWLPVDVELYVSNVTAD